MKFFLLLALFAAVFLCNTVYADYQRQETELNGNPEETEMGEVEFDTNTGDDFSVMPPIFGSQQAAPAFYGNTYRRCVRIRCPIKCWICICRCVQFA